MPELWLASASDCRCVSDNHRERKLQQNKAHYCTSGVFVVTSFLGTAIVQINMQIWTRQADLRLLQKNVSEVIFSHIGAHLMAIDTFSER